MLNELAGRLLYVMTLALVVACSGTSDGDGTTSSSGGGGSNATLSEACLASCAERSECGQASGSCSSLCDSVADAYSGSCAAAAASAFECEAGLGCSEFEDYVEDYRGSPCGDAYDDFATACGYEPTPPAECDAYCARAEQCVPELVVGGCADNCNILLGTFERQSGITCASAYASVFGCYRLLECSEMEALLSGEALPAGCNDELEAALEVCQ